MKKQHDSESKTKICARCGKPRATVLMFPDGTGGKQANRLWLHVACRDGLAALAEGKTNLGARLLASLKRKTRVFIPRQDPDLPEGMVGLRRFSVIAEGVNVGEGVISSSTPELESDEGEEERDGYDCLSSEIAREEHVSEEGESTPELESSSELEDEIPEIDFDQRPQGDGDFDAIDEELEPRTIMDEDERLLRKLGEAAGARHVRPRFV